MKNKSSVRPEYPCMVRALFCALIVCMILSVLPETAAFADVSRDKTLYVGETLTISHYSNYSKDFTYQWEVVSGADCIRILSDMNHIDCRVEAVKAGEAVLRGIAYRGKNHQYKHTVTIEILDPAFTVTFEANGGRVQEQTMEFSDGANVGTLPKPYRAGYSFSGWFTDPKGGTQVKNNTTLHLTGNMTLYAHWTANDNPSANDKSQNGRSSVEPSVSNTPPYHPDNSACPTCGGLGDCPNCFGLGTVECPNLCLVGNCPRCDGFGTTISYSGGKIVERKCVYCKGSGECSRCGGQGEVECRTCHGTGNCPTCGR